MASRRPTPAAPDGDHHGTSNPLPAPTRGRAQRRGVVTLADVADEVGVSPRTVSRVVNGQGGCSEETRLRIEAAIEDLGYRPNLLARGLLTNRSDTIGLVGPNLFDPFFTELADGVQRAARRDNRTMFFASTDDDARRQAQVVASFHGHGVDGVIVFPAPGSSPDLIRTASLGLPVVLINHELDGPNIATVQSDLVSGGRLAVEHLLSRGRRRIAMATEARTLIHQEQPRRQRGYREALEAAGIPLDPDLLATASDTVDGGRRCARQLMSLADPPDAIFAYNDLMAIGVLQELHRLGISVPDQVAVVGFDDIALCDAVIPRLSTIRIDRDQLGQVAVDTLWRLRDDPDATTSPTTSPDLLPVELVVRDSS